MAKVKDVTALNPKTQIELISFKGEKVFIKIITIEEWGLIVKNEHPTIKKKKGWKYITFQMGFSNFKNVKKL